ncbi:C6 zinc finger domain protein [Aspergillus clavatus NRRL 1]|uniref:C6 zinc finger domain protein n=1 Tax=Aspergillus clavatus (strain ATCC 1007 / CBS 513.65 / DSM 816 / NCTC 3887 / NRRL 1 / QM 1276 / 107) TaxID=344612 RepID=A1CA83_ASPCL|nr:C6 zinc finger domain protein [Aspergillus clavatus NRRL 1]EAW12651.1 C6 zinc finger domain protein [Aspergillus clavatus NRRL 1]
MDTQRRRQHHSCDPCRKGKRACDAPARRDRDRHTGEVSSSNQASSDTITCSNCRKYNRECTFNWLSENRAAARGGKKQKTRNATGPSRVDAQHASNPFTQAAVLGDMLSSSQWLSETLGQGVWSGNAVDQSAPWSLGHAGAVAIPLRGKEPDLDPFRMFSWHTNAGHVPPSLAESSGVVVPDHEELGGGPSLGYYQQSRSQSGPRSFDGTFDVFPPPPPRSDDSSPGLTDSYYSSSPGFPFLDSAEARRQDLTAGDNGEGLGSKDSISSLSVLSDNIADGYARSMMTRNLVRIYHDSMENALSCWLTEQNCPYNTALSPYKSAPNNGLIRPAETAWAPSWTNRICTRVCRLDRAYASARGRSLSASEEKMASRALHTAIMAFASQWAQKMPRKDGFSPTSPVAHKERAMRETLWNQARRALENAAGVPSFRVAFANIIFSVGQRPLNTDEDLELHELLEDDSAPLFLEAAVRQLFSIKHKLTRAQRQKKPRAGSLAQPTPVEVSSTASEFLSAASTGVPLQADAFYTDPEYQETINLMFWLVVMFDTLTAAMYQRPLVISDEDTQITSITPSDNGNDNEARVDLDGWNMTYARALQEKQDLWGDFFLRKRAARQQQQQQADPPSWPCSYDEAAEVLSDASPVKVLLFRQVTRLETLVYRGASPERLEEAIQKALRIYQHWNAAYKRFFTTCNAHHDDLPPRIQAWYVIVAGHWHLAAMLLADAVKGIDEGRLGLDSQREARGAIDFVATLRRDNALAAGAIAQRCLQGQVSLSGKFDSFHDSVNEAAFLTEPWTLVLIRCFAKAAYILLDEISLHPPPPRAGYGRPGDDPAEYARRTCEFCISALWCLGTKSDMAFVVARSLSNQLERKVGRRASPGCFQCTKRRIICDGGDPVCAKCQKKGIECSGQSRIRFTNGVASRGKLKGCVIPVVGVRAESVFAQGAPVRSQLRWREGRVHKRVRRGGKEEGVEVEDTLGRGGLDGDADADAEEEVTRGSEICPLAPWVAPLGARARMLFSHFARDVAPVMVLLDDVANGYRDFILPMACGDDLVRQAVEVVATQYLAQLQPAFSAAAETGRAALISRLRRESLLRAPERVFSAETWATLIVLLVGETVTASDEYHHLLRTLHSVTHNAAPVRSDVAKFLLQQTHMFELLGQPLLSEDQGLLVLRSPPSQTLDWLAYDLPATSTHHALLHLTRQAFTLASRIYLHRATTNHEQRALATQLRAVIAQIDADAPGAHALVWACFIAAADSADEALRAFFVARLRDVYARTRFRNVDAAVRALPGIWAGAGRWTEGLGGMGVLVM